MAHVEAIDHLSLSVTDVGRSSQWYQQVLGLEVVAEVEGDGFKRVRMRAPSGMTLTLTAHEATGGSFDERRPGMDHVAFKVVAGTDVEALVGRLEELGVTHSGVKQHAGGRPMVTLRDPDDIQLELFG